MKAGIRLHTVHGLYGIKDGIAETHSEDRCPEYDIRQEDV